MFMKKLGINFLKKSLIGTKNASDETIDEAEAVATVMERLSALKIKDKQSIY